MKNLSKFYYKDYFNGVDFSFLCEIEETDDKIENEKRKKEKKAKEEAAINIIKQRNKELCSYGLLNQIESNPVQNAAFNMKIAYPGLVTGIGINHEASIEGEFKLGMHFDYTYGMPVIYGSSVKGVLKAWFPEFCKQNDVKLFVQDIFEGKRGETVQKDGKDTTEYVNKSIYDRDIFFDAVITKGDNKGRILVSDSIMSHETNPLKNSNPITFLKIAPGCTIEFRFKLVNSTINGKTFSAQDKLNLFKKIIETVGIGAKTRVGYGQFD